uniref:Lipid transporter n=1 Tax=Arundo donax TaxID=35708 RepID=A0A0A9BDI6_ARUDO
MVHGGQWKDSRDEATMDKNTSRLLKVARVVFPIGIDATSVSCFHELWKQKIKLSNPSAAAVFSFEDLYAQAILISCTSDFHCSSYNSLKYGLLVY